MRPEGQRLGLRAIEVDATVTEDGLDERVDGGVWTLRGRSLAVWVRPREA